MKIEVLGSGTSTGVPVLGCSCPVCGSSDPRDNRLRTCVYVSALGDNSQPVGLLIDSPPDIRTQVLRSNITKVEAVLFTHPHADHMNGLDDLRVYNFINKAPLPLFGSPSTLSHLRRAFNYAFEHDPGYEGGAPPLLFTNEVEHGKSFEVSGLSILPIELLHGKMVVTGYRINDFAYLPDCNFISEESMEMLSGLSLLLIDGLRDRPHKTHFTQREAIAVIEKLAPKKALLTHICHEISHATRNEELKSWTAFDVELAYDQQIIEI